MTMEKSSAFWLSTAIVVGATLALSVTGHAQDLKVCKSTFALCTIAQCDAIPGNDKQVSCHCTVNTSYSTGAEPCSGVKNTPEGRQIHSRYYPVKSYAICTNDRPWACCLDKPCIIDKNDPTKAACACTSVNEEEHYVIVTSKYAASTCTTGIISSATVTQIDQVTDFLKESSQLKPFGINVLSSPK